jgi:hypothetical protein
VTTISVVQASGQTNAQPLHSVEILINGGSEPTAELLALLPNIARFDGEPSVVDYHGAYDLRVRPTSALTEGWHELMLSSPEYETPNAPETGWQDASGALHHRFFVGSAPYIPSLVLSPDKSKGGSLVVNFSEPIGVDELGPLEIRVDDVTLEPCAQGSIECASGVVDGSAQGVVIRLSPGPGPGVRPQTVSVRFPAAARGTSRTFAEAMNLVGFDGGESGLTLDGSEVVLSLTESQWQDCVAGLCWVSPLAVLE